MLSFWFQMWILQTTPTSSERVWCRAYQWQCYCHSSKNHFPIPFPTTLMISSFSPPVFGLSSKLCQNRTAGPLTGSIPILGGSSADKLSGPPPARKVSSCTSWCSGSSKQYSSGARTKRNSSDDPWKEGLPKQGWDKAMAFLSLCWSGAWQYGLFSASSRIWPHPATSNRQNFFQLLRLEAWSSFVIFNMSSF